jgi:hypothetical protein
VGVCAWENSMSSLWTADDGPRDGGISKGWEVRESSKHLGKATVPASTGIEMRFLTYLDAKQGGQQEMEEDGVAG